MILTTSEVERRLNSPNNLIRKLPPASNSIPISSSECNPPEIKSSTKTTKLDGDIKTIPEVVRDLISITSASSDETQKQVAEQFGVTSHTVSRLSRGLVGYKKDSRVKEVIDLATEKKKERKAALVEKSDTIHELALDSLVNTLTSFKAKVGPETDLHPEKLSRMAASLSKVVANTRENNKEADEGRSQPRIILFAPNLRQESYYESVEA